jgi:HAD superfamily hydrolase (TIGR01549 family)
MSCPNGSASLEARTRLKAIFFDLDGTLIDTDDAILEALASRLERFSGILPEENPRRFLRRIMLAAEGPMNRVVTLLDMVGLDDNVFSIGDRLRRLRGLAVQGRFLAVEGVVEMIRTLSDSYYLGIITTRSRRDASVFLRQFGLEELFQIVVTREDTRRLKPHPEPIHYAAGLLDLPATECAMVGDTAVDIISAKEAGSYAIGVLCGFGERVDLTMAGADLVLERTAQLQEWL